MSNEKQFIIGYDVIINGKISTVRWLEDAPYHATKVRSGKYYSYIVRIADENAAYQLLSKVDGSELAQQYKDDMLEVKTGVWGSVSPVFNTAEMDKAEAAERAIDDAAPIYDGWNATAQYLKSVDKKATNRACCDFVAAQLEMLWKNRKLNGLEQREVQNALFHIGGNYTEQSANYYSTIRDRMRELATKIK